MSHYARERWVRAPRHVMHDPCALSVRADDAPQRFGVGDAVTAQNLVSLSWPGEGELFLDGKLVGRYEDGVTLRIVPDGCHVLRLRLGGGFSAPVYLNCPFASIK